MEVDKTITSKDKSCDYIGLLRQGKTDLVIHSCSEQELRCKRPPPDIYKYLLTAYLIKGDMNEARLLYLRLSPEVRKTPDIKATWEVGRNLLLRNYSSITPPSTPTSPLPSIVLAAHRDRTIRDVGRAYKSLTRDDFCGLVVCRDNEIEGLVGPLGWDLNDGFVYPRPLPDTGGAGEGSEREVVIDKLSSYVAFLESIRHPKPDSSPATPQGLDPQRREMLEARLLGKSSPNCGPSPGPQTPSSRKLDSDSRSLGLHEFSDNSVSQDGALSPHGSITERKRRRLDMDAIKSPGARGGRKISEYFKSQQVSDLRKPDEVQPGHGNENVNGKQQHAPPTFPDIQQSYNTSPSTSRSERAATGVSGSGTMPLSGNDSNSSYQSNVSVSETSSQTVITVRDLQRLENAVMPPPTESSQLVDELRRTIDNLQEQYKEREAQFSRELDHERTRYYECQAQLKTLLLEKVRQFSKQSREGCNNNKLRLGQYNTIRSGAHFKEEWQHGYAFREHKLKQERFKQGKEQLENQQKSLRQKRKTINGPTPKKENRKNSDITQPVYDQQELYETEEILKIKATALRKEEADLQMEYEQLQQECQLHMREVKRIQAEDLSRFKDNPTLNKGRYLLLYLIGKGGFSEVHKAYDFEGQRYVACKVHQLAREWKDEKRMNYLKHAVREYNIQKSLNHPHIVSLYDVFEIDQMSFCTVLEFCDGNDLDFYLKQHKRVKEQEARCIIMQIVSALKYLNLRKKPIIHYDLKPGNILLVGKGDYIGDLKITDFGLSKIMEDQCDGGMELTSQGAGTYWYLPPECFTESPKISSKVDVWSVGIIFFQCLYGEKPFGNNMAQDAILKYNTILKAKDVEFPPNPKVSPEAKNFIRRCLEYRSDLRSDVLQLADDPYLKQPPKRVKADRLSAQPPQGDSARSNSGSKDYRLDHLQKFSEGCSFQIRP